MSCHVFVDFDGTIVPEDSTNQLLATFADASWLDIEDDWQSGLIGSRECMERQIDLVRATPRQLDRFIKGVEIDPEFAGFVRMCRSNGAAVSVVSDGLDRTVSRVLAAAGLELPFYANRLEWQGGTSWKLGFPYSKGDCRELMGNCKCACAAGPATTVRILVGDGRSDFCMARSAHFVLAKGSLLEHCREYDLPHMPFEEFGEARRILSRWFKSQARAAVPASAAAAIGDK
jgi:2,3-diketo-5-methylthio-1-phosphopentane phosphatase